MINLSERASLEFKKMLTTIPNEEAPDGVRVYISGRCGCGNPHYGMAFDELREGDQVLEVEGVKILLDPEVLPLVGGASIEYVQDAQREGFALRGLVEGCGGHGHHSQGHGGYR